VDLGAGETIILAQSAALYETRYGAPEFPLYQWDIGSLANSGELIELLDPSGKAVISFTYASFWFDYLALETGRCLIAADLAPHGADPIWSTPNNWQLSVLPLSTTHAALRFLDFMHAPPDPAGNYDNFAYLSFVNTGAASLNLQGVSLVCNVNYTFPDTFILPPGGGIIMVKNMGDFETRYTYDANVPRRAWSNGNIARNGGPDKITQLTDPEGNLIQAFTYSSAWHDGAANRKGPHLISNILPLPGDDPYWSTQAAWYVSADGNPVIFAPVLPVQPAFTDIFFADAATLVLPIANPDAIPVSLEYRDALNAGQWLPVPGSALEPVGDGVRVRLDELPPTNTRFFRLAPP
jgi:hypothetical protein